MSRTRSGGTIIDEEQEKEQEQNEKRKSWCKCGSPLFDDEKVCADCVIKELQVESTKAATRAERAKGSLYYAAAFAVAAIGGSVVVATFSPPRKEKVAELAD